MCTTKKKQKTNKQKRPIVELNSCWNLKQTRPAADQKHYPHSNVAISFSFDCHFTVPIISANLSTMNTIMKMLLVF